MSVSISVRLEEVEKIQKVLDVNKVKYQWSPKKRVLRFPSIEEWNKVEGIIRRAR